MKDTTFGILVFVAVVVIIILGVIDNYFYCFVNCPEEEEKSIEEKTVYSFVSKPYTIRAENSVYDDNVSNIKWVNDRIDVNFYFDGLNQSVELREYVYEYGWIILQWLPDKYVSGMGMDDIYIMPRANGETEEFYFFDPEVIQNQKEYFDSEYETVFFRTKKLGSKHISIVAYEDSSCFPEGCVNYTSIEIIGSNTPELPLKTKSNLLYKLEVKR